MICFLPFSVKAKLKQTWVLMVLMVLSEDYTPKYTVAESRLIPLSLAAVRGGVSGVFPTPPQGIPDGTCREFVKKWRICPRGLPAGQGSGVWSAPGPPLT